MQIHHLIDGKRATGAPQGSRVKGALVRFLSFCLFTLCLTAAIAVATTGPAHADTPASVGIRTMALQVPERAQAIELTLWYPAEPQGAAEILGPSKLFKSVSVFRDAPVAKGRFPVVLLAHGGLRANPRMGDWLAHDLASRGYLAVVAQAPRLGPKDAKDAVRETWLRPADLSAALSAVERDPRLVPNLAAGKAGVVGFLRGGTSALALAGARLDAASFMRACDDPKAGPDCAWFAQSGVDLRTVDAQQITRSHRDARILVSIAVAPEWGQQFDAASLSALNIPVDLIHLGKPAPGVETSDLPRRIPQASYQAVADATPFSAFALCTAQAAALLREDGDDEALCQDGGGRSREAIHAELAALIDTALQRAFARK